jgi:hypothetical protein
MAESNLPIPDPTALTTAQLLREQSSLREIMEVRINGVERSLEQQLAAAVELILSHIKNVADVSNERFSGIATQFLERDTRTEQAAQESRISLDAALAAAKEAVSEQNKANSLAIGKSEDATKERLDALQLLFSTSNKSLEDKISDAKSRLDSGGGQEQGKAQANVEQRDVRVEHRSVSGLNAQMISLYVAIAGLAALILLHKP